MEDRQDAAKMVSSAILGYDCRNVIVGSKIYTIAPPTIKRIAGAGYYLADIATQGNSLLEIIRGLKDIGKIARALSWLVAGDESLAEELGEGTLDELVEALSEGISLISAENFIVLLGLAKSVAHLTANQR